MVAEADNNGRIIVGLAGDRVIGEAPQQVVAAVDDPGLQAASDERIIVEECTGELAIFNHILFENA